MKKFGLVLAVVASLAASVMSLETPSFAAADVIVRNTGGFFAKRASDGKYYPAMLCFSTDGSQTLIPCGKHSGGVGMSPARLDTSSSPILTSAYSAFVASTGADATWVNVYNGTARELVLATGTVGAAVDKLEIAPSAWTGPVPLYIPAGSALSLIAKGSSVSSGVVMINLVQ